MDNRAGKSKIDQYGDRYEEGFKEIFEFESGGKLGLLFEKFLIIFGIASVLIILTLGLSGVFSR